MEGSHVKLWITTLVVLYGLSWNSYGQKTFKRACDCEYMVDGKCAYTLLLPSGQLGESMCPQNGNMDSMNGEMSGEIQQKVNDLHRNFTQLLSMYSSQATMLNQVYSTLMDKLLVCPLLQSCAMPSFTVPDIKVPTVTVPTVNIPDVTMPDVEMPDVTMPDIEMPEVTMPDIKVPEVTMPDIKVPEVTMPDVEFTMPDIQIPVPKCTDVCPDIDIQLESIRILASEIDRTVVDSVTNITKIFDQIRYLNATVTELGIRVLTGGDGDSGDKPQPNPGVPNPGIPNPGIPNPGIPNPGLPNQGTGDPNLNLASMGLWLNNIIMSGALCLRKGPLVSGDDSFISDESISSSSIFNEQHVATRVRINSVEEGDLKGAWCPGNSSQANAQGEPNIPGQEWIQFDLGRIRTVYGIVTRGRADYAQWVTSYMVYYKDELNPFDPAQTEWTQLTDMLDLDTVIFNANKDQDTPMYNYFDNPIQARYVRIIPLSANEGQNMCMRADVIGCVEEPTLL